MLSRVVNDRHKVFNNKYLRVELYFTSLGAFPYTERVTETRDFQHQQPTNYQHNYNSSINWHLLNGKNLRWSDGDDD